MSEKDQLPSELKDAVVSAIASALSGDAPPQRSAGNVIAEKPITVAVYRVGEFTLMATPTDLETLAVGFAFSEGMIDSLDDLLGLNRAGEAGEVVVLEVRDPTRVMTGRNMIVASSCGLCGAKTVARTLSEMPAAGHLLRMEAEALLQMTDKLFALQTVHPLTRGAHAAGIFSADGAIRALAEDIGRHNALDKAIGKCLLDRITTAGSGAVLSSRASFEMVAKAARAGIELLVAAAAPSSLAVEAAERWQLTLCGMARHGRANVYTHPGRII
jgi:FdhD protein